MKVLSIVFLAIATVSSVESRPFLESLFSPDYNSDRHHKSIYKHKYNFDQMMKSSAERAIYGNECSGALGTDTLSTMKVIIEF